MTRVGNTEQILALVRNQLQRMAKRERTGKAREVRKPESRPLNPRERVQALSAIENLSGEDFAHGFVRALLSEEFGPEAANSPAFREVVEKTASAMQADPEVAQLIRRVREEL